MNWDAIAAIAELVASFGVIVSLICLATQIRYLKIRESAIGGP